MGRKIKLTRSELVWQTREITWDETDWEKFVDQLKKWAELKDEESYYKQVYGPIYEVAKDLTWEQVLDDLNKRENAEESITVKIIRRYNIGTEQEFSDTYDEYLADVIKDAMREDCYESSVCDEDYADDYEEDFKVLQNGDED